MRRAGPLALAAGLALALLLVALLLGRGGDEPALEGAADPGSDRSLPADAPPGPARPDGGRPATDPTDRPVPGLDPGRLADPGRVDRPPIDPTRPPLEGQVLTIDGRAAGGATVVLREPGAEGKPRSVVADRDGRFAFALARAAKGIAVHAARSDLGQSATVEVDVLDLASPPFVEIQLERRTLLEGRVTDAAGEAIAGATVRLVHLPGLSLEVHEVERADGIATTDDGGRYRIEEVGPGNKRLVVSAPGWPGKWVDLRIEAGQTGRVLDVALPPASVVEGTVRLDGRPLGGAVVQLVRARREPGDPGETVFARSDERGRFEVGGVNPSEWYQVQVYHPDLGSTRVLGDPIEGTHGRLDLEF